MQDNDRKKKQLKITKSISGLLNHTLQKDNIWILSVTILHADTQGISLASRQSSFN